MQIPRVGYADDMVCHCEDDLQQLVHDDRARVCEAEEGVISETCL